MNADFTMRLQGKTWRAEPVSECAHRFMRKIFHQPNNVIVGAGAPTTVPTALETPGSGILLRQLIEANGLTVEGEIPTI